MRATHTDSAAFEAIRMGLIEDASTNDKRWFKRHPGVTRYYRDYRPGEFPDGVSQGVANDVAQLRSQAKGATRVRVVVEVTQCRADLRIRRPHVIAWSEETAR